MEGRRRSVGSNSPLDLVQDLDPEVVQVGGRLWILQGLGRSGELVAWTWEWLR
jgi:hypothetical protein